MPSTLQSTTSKERTPNMSIQLRTTAWCHRGAGILFARSNKEYSKWYVNCGSKRETKTFANSKTKQSSAVHEHVVLGSFYSQPSELFIAACRTVLTPVMPNSALSTCCANISSNRRRLDISHATPRSHPANRLCCATIILSFAAENVPAQHYTTRKPGTVNLWITSLIYIRFFFSGRNNTFPIDC